MLKTILSKIVLAMILFLGICYPGISANAQNKSELFLKGAEAIKNGKTEAGLNNMIRQAALNNDNQVSATLGGFSSTTQYVKSKQMN